MRRHITIDRWNDLHQEATAHLISAAYQGHVDSRINDQYRSAVGARRFLHNIVQYPGCGTFFRPASFAAFEPARGLLAGISLASLVSQECGHITQICVSPDVKGTGVGYALLRQSLLALRDMGCRSATLTVTAANEEAVALVRARRLPHGAPLLGLCVGRLPRIAGALTGRRLRGEIGQSTETAGKVAKRLTKRFSLGLQFVEKVVYLRTGRLGQTRTNVPQV